jgi:dynein heavy chain, axonemal
VEFKEKKSTAMVCSDLRKLYESFKPYLPLIIALRNPSLKLRHWENLQNLRNPPIYELESEMHASIYELVERCQIMDIVEEINDISDCASREKKLEDAIQKMKDEWRYIKFELAEYRESGTHVIKGAEPIWDMLDDHIMKTMTIASSPYIKFL